MFTCWTLPIFLIGQNHQDRLLRNKTTEQFEPRVDRNPSHRRGRQPPKRLEPKWLRTSTCTRTSSGTTKSARARARARTCTRASASVCASADASAHRQLPRRRRTAERDVTLPEWLHGTVHEQLPTGPIRGLFTGRFLPIFTDCSGFLARLHPRRTRLQKPLNTLGVGESSSPRRAPPF